MANTSKIEKTARKLCTHTVVFTTGTKSKRIGELAAQGLTTRGIAELLNITEAQVQYAISKAQHRLGRDVRLRRDYRNGSSPLARRMLTITRPLAEDFVARQIASKFIPLAAPGVSRIAG